jgi:gliding motility-associated-like protein
MLQLVALIFLTVEKYFIRILFSLYLAAETITVTGQLPMPDDVCIGQTRVYSVEPVVGSFYIWRIDGVVQNNFSTNEIIYTWVEAGSYIISVQEVSAAGCVGPLMTGLVNVRSDNEIRLKIYKAFSPNGDLINDEWRIENSVLYPSMEVIIFNRWGQLVWKSGRGYPKPWDGTSNGYLLPVDSYHFIIELHNGDRPVIGSVTLVR